MLGPFYAPIKRKQLDPGWRIKQIPDVKRWRHLYTADKADTKQTHAETETQTLPTTTDNQSSNWYNNAGW